MNNNNFAIVVATKNRPYLRDTFKKLEQLKSGTPVYLYVDENEKNAYKEMFPAWEIVPHNLKNIIKIRALCQKHQHDLNNNFLMLDDDITQFYFYRKENPDEKFVRSINDMVQEAETLLRENDFIHAPVILDKDFYFGTIHKETLGEIPKHWSPQLFACVGMTPRLYDLGIRYENSQVDSEDIWLTIEIYLAEARGDISIGMMDALFELNGSSEGHFQTAFYHESVVEAYIQYGYVLDFIMHSMRGIPYSLINKAGIKHLAETGKPLYSPYYDQVLELMDLKKIYSKPIERMKWKKGKKYDEKKLKEIDKRKLFQSLVNFDIPSPFGNDFLLELKMKGRAFKNCPAIITEENFPLLIDITNPENEKQGNE